MKPDLLKIAGGRVIDPANDVDAVRDVWIDRASGRVVDPPADPDVRPARAIDARGNVIMPGGVDIHCHIAGSKVNAARLLRPEDARASGAVARTAHTRSGTLGSVPSTFATGYKYAGLGYTCAVDAAIPPLGARHAHHELRDTPAIDRAILVLMGNNHFVMDRVREGDAARLRDYMAWLLGATRAYGVKVVNPGGVERWKEGHGTVTSLDDDVPGFGVTPRAILTALADAADALRLPHPIHVHGPNLGLPGNAATTLDVLKTLDGRRAHLAHIQFQSYGGDPADASSLRPDVAALADHVNTHRDITLDVGQVVFGATTSMTADGRVGQYLHEVTGRKWLSHDVEQETGCGVVPIAYEDTNYVHALQWAIGLEWFLRVVDPWKVALSTDHPNGGSFLAYPRVIAQLMSKNLRDEMLARLPARARRRTGLADLGREFSLSEIAVVTRAGPARMLGMADRGHLGPGALGDVTIYTPDDDRARMFALPRWVIKEGRVVIDDGGLVEVPDGRTLSVVPSYDAAIVPSIRDWFDREASLRFANFPIEAHEFEEVAP